MRLTPPALKSKDLPAAKQEAITEDLSKCYAGAIHTYERHRPKWVSSAAYAMLSTRAHLKFKLAQLLASDSVDHDELNAIKAAIVENELALGKSPVMTTSLNDLARDLMQKHSPLEKAADEDPAAFDSTTSKTKAGVLSGDELRKQINRNLVRVKIGGLVFSGSANAVASYIAQQNRFDRDQLDMLSKKIANQQLNNNNAGILANAIVDDENREVDTEIKTENEDADNELAFETARESAIEKAELRREAMIESGAEPGLDDDLYDDIGVHHTASDTGIDLAFDNESTRLEIEREVEIDMLRQRYEAGKLEPGELQSELERIENSYANDSLKLARSHSILRTPSLRQAWEETLRAAGKELPKGDPSNRALSPSSATGKLMHGIEETPSLRHEFPKPETITSGQKQ